MRVWFASGATGATGAMGGIGAGAGVRAGRQLGRAVALPFLIAGLLAGAARAQTSDEVQALSDKSNAAAGTGDFAAAEGFAQQAFELGEKVLPAGDPRLPVLANNAGLLHEKQENWPAASAAFARTVELRSKTEGADSPALREPLQKLAQAQARSQQYADAYATGERALGILEQQYGDESLEYADASASLAVLAIQDKHAKRAERHLRQALSIYKDKKGEESIEVGRTLFGLAIVNFQNQQPGAAADYMRKASKVFESVPDGHPDKLAVLEQRVAFLKNAKQPVDAKLVEELERNRAAAATFKPQAPDVGSK